MRGLRGLLSGIGKVVKGIIGKVIPRKKKSKTEPEPVESDIIISNFKSLISSMTDTGYKPEHHTFTGHKPLTDKGTRAKENSRDWIYEALDRAISDYGKDQVARNIQRNGEFLQQLVEDLIFAIYDGRFAVWSGGMEAYKLSLRMEFEGILREE